MNEAKLTSLPGVVGCRQCHTLWDQLCREQKRVAHLEQAIKDHRSQKADDRCIEDDDRLYEALGDGIKCDRRVGDKEAMRKNCDRFIDNRCEAGGWISYAELERRYILLRQKVLWLLHDLGERYPGLDAQVRSVLGNTVSDIEKAATQEDQS